MKSICAWCGVLLKDFEGGPDLISHGICPDCGKKLREKAKEIARTAAKTLAEEVTKE